MRSLIPAAMLLLLAGCAPTNIAHSTCQSHPLTVADEWTCTVKGPLVDTTNSVRYTTESRNQIAKVQIALQVTKGTLRVTYADLEGSHQLLVTASEPAAFSMQTRLSRDDRSFTVMYEPFNGAVEGLTGTVNYSTP
jgi:hypothetical protein